MAMSVETIRDGLRTLRDDPLADVTPCEQPDKTKIVRFGSGEYSGHLRWMVDTALSWPDERREKMMRWLCFVQGALWACGYVSVDGMKQLNAPPEAKR